MELEQMKETNWEMVERLFLRKLERMIEIYEECANNDPGGERMNNFFIFTCLFGMVVTGIAGILYHSIPVSLSEARKADGVFWLLAFALAFCGGVFYVKQMIESSWLPSNVLLVPFVLALNGLFVYVSVSLFWKYKRSMTASGGQTISRMLATQRRG
eukprot:Hpha_TRINITY_DN16461_c2_g9::TRINITY_DN16461_c2_g9_i1::g.160020::m.160020